MKILITGGRGFIGKNIISKLKKKHILFSPSHNELDIKDELLLRKYLKLKKIDAIIHSAIVNGSEGFEDNLRMFESIFRNSDVVKKIIHFGSGAEYAKNRNLVKVKETDWGKYVPQDSYGFAKFLIQEKGSKVKNITNLRLFGIYGPGEDYLKKFISNSVAKNIFNLPISIKQDVVFDYLFIDDLIKVLDFFLKANVTYSDYNVTPDTSISLVEIVKIINKISRKNSEITVVNKGLNYQYTGDNSRLRNEMPLLKFYSYEEGILKLYQHLKNNKSIISKQFLIKDDYFAISRIRKVEK